MWDLWWTKWHWDRFFPEYFGFPCQFHSTGAPLLGKGQKASHHTLDDHSILKVSLEHLQFKD
jgi:hypothetical protein